MKIDRWGFNRTKSIFEIGNILVRKKLQSFFYLKANSFVNFEGLRIQTSIFANLKSL